MNNLDKLVNDNIILIIECCKIEQNSKLIEEKVSYIKDWDEFISTAYSHGIFPLVYLTLKKYEDKIPSAILNHMKSIYMNIVKQNMLMTSELLNVLKIFEENHIACIPFKGPTLTKLAYGDIISRQYVDLDILINMKDFESVIKLLNELDYISKLNYEISIEKIKDIICDHLFTKEKSNINIEIHNKLFSINFPINIPPTNFFNNQQTININNTDVKTFSNEYLLFYLCLHGCKHLFSRLSWLLDIHKIINSLDIDWKEFIKIVEVHNTKSLVYTSLFLSETLFQTKLPDLIKIKHQKKYQKLITYILNNNEDYEVTDKFSFVHLLLFDNFREKFLYVFYLFRPSFLDYQSVNKEYKSELVYFLIRPINILLRLFKS